MKIIQYTYLSD